MSELLCVLLWTEECSDFIRTRLFASRWKFISTDISWLKCAIKSMTPGMTIAESFPQHLTSNHGACCCSLKLRTHLMQRAIAAWDLHSVLVQNVDALPRIEFVIQVFFQQFSSRWHSNTIHVEIRAEAQH